MLITIVGSMKFHKEYEKIKQYLEKNKHKVIVPKPDEFYSKEKNIKLKAMQDFNKNLSRSDAILVANYTKEDKPHHIGINTLMEIGMAFNQKKKIFLLNPIPQHCKEELEAIGVIIINNDLNKIT